MERQLKCYLLSANAAAALVFAAGCGSLNNAAMDATAEVAEASVSRAQVVAELREAGTELVGRFGCAFLVKGGHLREPTATDLLVERDGAIRPLCGADDFS